MRSRICLLRRLQVGEIFLVGKSAHIGLAVAHAHGVKPALRLQDLARALDVRAVMVSKNACTVFSTASRSVVGGLRPRG